MYDCICPTCKGKPGIIATENLPADYLNEIEKAFKETLKQVYTGKTPGNKMLVVTGKALTEQVRQSYQAITIDWTTPDAEMLVQLSRNVWHFSAAKNWQHLHDLSLALKDEKGKG